MQTLKRTSPTFLSDKDLLLKVRELVASERKTLSQILDCLQEIQRRRLYADLGYSSLYRYLVEELHYSEAAAHRRVSALKISERLPETKRMIAKGEINLTVVALAQKYTRKESSNKAETIVQELKHKTKDQAEKILLTHYPDKKENPRELKSRVSHEAVRLHITLDDEVLCLLDKVKALKRKNTAEAIKFALQSVLEFEKEKNKKVRRVKKEIKKNTKEKPTRYIPTKVKKEIRLRAKNRCEYPGCKEIHHLEFDHIVPFSKGGTSNASNIRLYCKAHNQRAAIKELGLPLMEKYLN